MGNKVRAMFRKLDAVSGTESSSLSILGGVCSNDTYHSAGLLNLLLLYVVRTTSSELVCMRGTPDSLFIMTNKQIRNCTCVYLYKSFALKPVGHWISSLLTYFLSA